MKIRYCLERIELYIPAPLRCFKCQKYGHHRKRYKEPSTCGTCGQRELDMMGNGEIVPTSPNAQTPKKTLSHFQKLRNIRKRDGNHWGIKYWTNITFLDDRKIVKSDMQDNIYTNVPQKASPIISNNTRNNSNNDQLDRYRARLKNLPQLRPNDWPK